MAIQSSRHRLSQSKIKLKVDDSCRSLHSLLALLYFEVFDEIQRLISSWSVSQSC